MAEIAYTGRPARGSGSHGPRPSTAPSPRLEGAGGRVSAGKMLSFLDAAEGAAARQQQPSMFPSSASLPSGARAGAGGGGGGGSAQRQRPKSAAPLRTTGDPRVRQARVDTGPSPAPPPPRQHGRLSLFDHSTKEQPPHEVPGPTVLRDLARPRVGFPARTPEAFMRSGEGLSLRQRTRLREHLKAHPVNTEAPFVPGTGGVRLLHPPSPSPASPASPSSRPASASSAAPPLSFACSRQPLPHSLLRTYYDNGTLDFVSVRWRGSRADALAWARRIDKGPQDSAHARSYACWGPELPSELDLAAWLPVFVDGLREYGEPYRFIAIRGAEDMLFKAGDTLHTLAASLVSPLKAALDTREPTTVAVVLQVMVNALALDPLVAAEWVPHYWQFAQVLNLFRSRGGALVVDMGYNKRAVRSCRELATTFMTDFELAGGAAATAAVRRYSPGHDPAVTDASMARAAAKAAARAAEVGGAAAEPGAFKPFTLF